MKGGGRNVAPFSLERRRVMAMKSRYQMYMQGLNKIKEKEDQRSTPQSILEKLKELKGNETVISVPVGDADE